MKELACSPVEEGVDEGKVLVKGPVVFCFEHAAYIVVSEKTVESEGVVGGEDADVEAGSRRLLLKGGQNDVGLLEDEDADEKE